MAASTAASSNYKEFLIDISNVQIADVIGRGGVSQVWLVHVKDTVTGETRKAAAKKVRNNETIEVQVMKSLDHPNVVTFYGILMDTPDTYIIMELAENGDLRRYLDAWREKEKSRLPIRLVWKWIFEAAQGIHYLHQKKHTHRDIKSLNYLIMDGLTIKLGDLGLAKEMDLTQETSGVRGTCRWMAPEVIKEQKRSIKSDIYSFGIVVWEVFTTAIPFEEIRGDFQVMNSVCNGARPTIPDDCPDPLRQLIEVCWQEDYKKRPDMAEVCDILQQDVQRQQSCEELTKQLEGAAISIGSDDTPMELSLGLDTDNHKGQEETVSSQGVFKLPSETPAEILTRGPAALEAYTKASQDGTTPVYRTRLMLVGQERVGKTSLMKSITGQKFNSAESSTDGVDASTRCEVTGNSNAPWEIQLTDPAEYVQSQYEDTMSELMVQRLTERGQENEELQNDEQLSARDSEQSIGIQKEALDETQMRDSFQGQQKDGEPSSQEIRKIDDTSKLSEENEHETKPAAKEAVVPGALMEKVQARLRKKIFRNELEEIEKESRVQEFQIWDFAGQDVYYTTHQVFLNNRAIYIVTFDLCHDLTKSVKIQIPSADMVQPSFHELTGHGFLDFWMQSIYAYATTSQHQPDKKRPQLSPPIFIVGTHRESPVISKDPIERKQLIEAQFQSISDMIAGKRYEKHVVSKYYAIENNSTDKDDYELSQLKEHIVSVATKEPYMGEQIPLRWLTFEKSLAEAINKDQHYMDLEQVKDITNDLGIKSDTELFTMLHFYHDLGTIIYYGGDDSTNSHLQDMVILDPQWLIDVFKKIITVLPYQKQWPTLKDKWRRLKEQGILEDDLIDHMWHDLLPQKTALLELMEMFDLLCPRIHADKEGLKVKTYYVPACLQPCSEEDEKAGERKQTIFYIDFHGFLPDGLFHRLIVHAARWSQLRSEGEPKLFHRYGDFCIDDEHGFELKMLTTKPVCIKVTISIIPVMSSGESEEEDSCLVQPCHVVCDSVKTFLTQILKDLTTTWGFNISYTFSVACPACNDLQKPPQPRNSRCLHLLPLKDCLKKPKIMCNEKKILIKTDDFKMRFQGVTAGDSLNTKKTSSSSEDSGMQKLSQADTRLIANKAELRKADLDNLFEELGISEADIDNGRRNADTTDFKLQSSSILRDWLQKKASAATRNVIIKALRECDLKDAAEFLEKEWGITAQ